MVPPSTVVVDIPFLISFFAHFVLPIGQSNSDASCGDQKNAGEKRVFKVFKKQTC